MTDLGPTAKHPPARGRDDGTRVGQPWAARESTVEAARGRLRLGATRSDRVEVLTAYWHTTKLTDLRFCLNAVGLASSPARHRRSRGREACGVVAPSRPAGASAPDRIGAAPRGAHRSKQVRQRTVAS